MPNRSPSQAHRRLGSYDWHAKRQMSWRYAGRVQMAGSEWKHTVLNACSAVTGLKRSAAKRVSMRPRLVAGWLCLVSPGFATQYSKGGIQELHSRRTYRLRIGYQGRQHRRTSKLLEERSRKTQTSSCYKDGGLMVLNPVYQQERRSKSCCSSTPTLTSPFCHSPGPGFIDLPRYLWAAWQPLHADNIFLFIGYCSCNDGCINVYAWNSIQICYTSSRTENAIFSFPTLSRHVLVPGHPSMPTLTPLMRSVKTECEREERSFMRVAATLRQDWATVRREWTCEGEVNRITSMSVTPVKPVLPSCLISCFFLSNSHFPRRSLIVSLYWRVVVRKEKNGDKTQLTISRNWPSILYSQPLIFIWSATWKTCSTAQGIIPELASD